MLLRSHHLVFATSLLAAACEPAAPRAEAASSPPATQAERGSREWKLTNALSAGPTAVTAEAAVMDWPASPSDSPMELRPGTNGWVCMPDVPSTPGVDPMCLDASFQEWAAAWSAHAIPGLKGVGLGYMLQGGSDASNTDPFATEADSTPGWISTGPHVMMVVPDPSALGMLSADYRSGLPWVMFQGTPYAHVMMPVR